MATHNNKGSEYESLILEKIRYEFDDNFSYEKNYRIKGKISETNREFDIAIFRENQENPFWIIECKRLTEKSIKEKLIKDIEQMPTKVKNLTKLPEIITFVVPYKPSIGSINTAINEKIKIDIVSKEEALKRSWFYEAHEIFPYDIIFHPKIYQTKKLIINNRIAEAINKLDGIFFEEWLNVIDYSINTSYKTTISLLKTIAEYHNEDGWRFNAIQKLLEYNELEEEFRLKLIEKEYDFETKSLLINLS